MQNSLDFIEQVSQGINEIKKIGDIQYAYNPRTLVYQRDKIKLYHYHAKSNKNHRIPILIVFATINRPEILDLLPEYSFIHHLLKQGLDIYLLDWGYPDANDKMISLDDYITDYLAKCVRFIAKKSQQKKINLLGVCQGGVLCLCYAALFANIKSLTLISTPIDFHTRNNKITRLIKHLDINTLTKTPENIPGGWLTQFFIFLRPFELIGKKYLRFIDNLADKSWTDKFLHMEKWLHDAPDQANLAFRQFMQHFYHENMLIKNQLNLAGKTINLSNLTLPILNIMASKDEIIPISASRVLKKYVRSENYVQKIYPAGHIGIYVSEPITRRMAKTIALWLMKNTLLNGG